MGLLDFVQQHHGVRLAADLLGKLAAFLVAYISRRRSDQTGGGVFLHVFGHIDADHGIFVAEESFSKRAGQLGFADAGGTEENEGAHRALRILQACTGPADGAADGFDGFVLADYPVMQNVFHLQETFGFLFGQLPDRHSGPACHDLGDIIRRYHGVGAALLFLPLVAGGFQLFAELLLGIPECSSLLELLALHRGVLLLAHILQLLLHLLQAGRYGVGLQANLGAGFVDQVNGFVRQEPVGNIAVGELHGLNNGFVRNFYPVMGFITVAESVQNLHSLLRCRLIHSNGLEASLQSGVLLNVFAVFIQRGGADALQLAAGQGRLQDVGGIDGAFRTACTDQGVQLVDEQDDIAGLADFVHDFLQTVLELASVFGARYDGAHIQSHYPLIPQCFGNFVVDDLLGQPFGNGGFTNAGFTDQHRIVLGAAAQHLNHPLNFLAAPDYRIQMAILGAGRQIAGQAVQGGRADIGRCAVAGGNGFAGAQKLQHLLAGLVETDAQIVQHPGSHAFTLADQAQEYMFSAHVSMAQLARLVHGKLNHLFCPGRIGDIGRLLLPAANQGFHFVLNLLQAQTQGDQRLGGDAFPFLNQSQQNMLCTDIVVPQPHSFLLCQGQYLLGTLRKSAKHHREHLQIE
ncbi:hypothetical protein D3C75_598080 [compost metagenome]